MIDFLFDWAPLVVVGFGALGIGFVVRHGRKYQRRLESVKQVQDGWWTWTDLQGKQQWSRQDPRKRWSDESLDDYPGNMF